MNRIGRKTACDARTAVEYAARSRWMIEHSLHWVLDVTMNEDRQRNRKGHGPHHFARLRRRALSIARLEPRKGSMRGKLKKDGGNDDFLLAMVRAVLSYP